MERLENIHPGEILLEEFLKQMQISAYKLSKDLDIPQTRISQIIKGNRRITADTALRLSSYFGNSAKFWLGLQDDYDLEEERHNKIEIFKKIRSLRENAKNKKCLRQKFKVKCHLSASSLPAARQASTLEVNC
jgi:addiction module HigA family antidote